jgi:hypothetical protein
MHDIICNHDLHIIYNINLNTKLLWFFALFVQLIVLKIFGFEQGDEDIWHCEGY